MTFKMNKLLLFTVLAFVSCSEDQNTLNVEEENVQNTTLNDQSTSDKDNTKEVKAWLELVIQEYFKQDLNDWSTITTKEYAEYKSDMINSIYSHGIELDSLKKKWSYKYEVTKSKTGVGFLIGAQDYYNIVIKSCKALSSENQGEYVFKVILCDTGYDQCYESDITVIKYVGSYAIDGTKEYF